MYYELTDHFTVPANIDETWKFFSTAENLPAITPPSLGFCVLTPSPIDLQQDSLIDYTIRVGGLRLHWRTRIIDWSPPRQFVDLQIKGPYRLWHHQHRFCPNPNGGTDCEDRVTYSLFFGPLGRVAHALVVRRQLLNIFRFRRRVIAERLGPLRHFQDDVEIGLLG